MAACAAMISASRTERMSGLLSPARLTPAFDALRHHVIDDGEQLMTAPGDRNRATILTFQICELRGRGLKHDRDDRRAHVRVGRNLRRGRNGAEFGQNDVEAS